MEEYTYVLDAGGLPLQRWGEEAPFVDGGADVVEAVSDRADG